MLGQVEAQGQGHILCHLWVMLSALQKASREVRVHEASGERDWEGRLSPGSERQQPAHTQHRTGDDCRALTFLLEADTRQDEAIVESSGPSKPAGEGSLQTTTCTLRRDSERLQLACWRGAFLQVDPSLPPAPPLEAGGYNSVAPQPRHCEMELLTFLPAQQPALMLVAVLKVGAHCIKRLGDPRQGVPSESLVSPLSITTPSSKGSSSLQACPH